MTAGTQITHLVDMVDKIYMQNVSRLEKCYSWIFDFHFQIGEKQLLFFYMLQCRSHTFAMTYTPPEV